MTKFFRKIRQNLLLEGRMWKYLKYAIGEIILVVFGILIALQINNWNENRKALNKQQLLFEQLLSDAKADSVFFQSRLGGLNILRTTFNMIKAYEEDTNFDISIINTNGQGNAMPYSVINFGSILLENNENIYNEIINTPVKKQLRSYRAKYGYIQSSYSYLNKRLREVSENVESKYYKEFRFNKKDGAVEPLQKIYSDPYLHSNVDDLLLRIKIAETMTMEYLEENRLLSKIIQSHLRAQ